MASDQHKVEWSEIHLGQVIAAALATPLGKSTTQLLRAWPPMPPDIHDQVFPGNGAENLKAPGL